MVNIAHTNCYNNKRTQSLNTENKQQTQKAHVNVASRTTELLPLGNRNKKILLNQNAIEFPPSQILLGRPHQGV
jgi:hypothetical protein